MQSRLSPQNRADYNSQWIEGLAGLSADLINVRKGKILTLLGTSCVSCIRQEKHPKTKNPVCNQYISIMGG